MNSLPRCIIVTGRPGAGKTTLARKLSELLRLPMLSRDQIKEGIVGTFGVSHDNLPADTNRKATDLFFSATEVFLKGNVSVLVEAAFQHKLWEEVVARWSGMSRVIIIVCEADPTLCSQRHLDRGLGDPSREFFHGDKRATEFKMTGKFLPPGDYVPPVFDVPALRVSTEVDYFPALPAITDFVLGRLDRTGHSP